MSERGLMMPDSTLRRYHCEVCGWSYLLPPRLAHWLTEHMSRHHNEQSMEKVIEP